MGDFTKRMNAEKQERRRWNRMSVKQKRAYDQMKSSLATDPHQALITGTASDKRLAIATFNFVGNLTATENKNLDGVDLRGQNNDRRSFAGSSLSHSKIDRASGANFNSTTSFNLDTRGGDTSGSSWNMAAVIAADARHSNRRGQNMEGTLQAFNNSSDSDSEGIRISGFGIMNQHGNENLSRGTISGWQVASSYNGAFAQDATITGRADMNDYSDMDISRGTLNVHSPLAPIVTHGLKAKDATVGLGRTENAQSANLENAATILDDGIAAMMEEKIAEQIHDLPAYGRRHGPRADYNSILAAPKPAEARRQVLRQAASLRFG